MHALLIWPRFIKSFFSNDDFAKWGGRKAVNSPVSLMTVAALLPQTWTFRLVDVNAEDLSPEDWEWADMVFLSGMISQKPHLLELIAEAKQRDLPVVMGGPLATATPEPFAEAGVDFLVLDEGEVTIPPFIAALESGAKKGVFRSNGERADMHQSPTPRFDLIKVADYYQMHVQFSRGCPFQCEFCDIPPMFGHRPRTKTPTQVIRELQTLLDQGWNGTVFIADDNFIGHKKNVIPLLESLRDWQRETGYRVGFSTEASLNMADDPKLLALMREAGFRAVFIGIETPDEDTLIQIRKKQNTRHDMVARINTIYGYGMRVMAGIIIGFDGEKQGVNHRIIRFLEEASIPLVLLNMLYAMPHTPLTKRLEKEGRLRRGCHKLGVQMTNFVPTRPLTEVVAEYADCWKQLADLDGFLDRLHRNCLLMGPKIQKKRALFAHPREVVALLVILWLHGIQRPTRFKFWRLAADIWRKNRPALRRYLIYCAEYEHLNGFVRYMNGHIFKDLESLGEDRHVYYSEGMVINGQTGAVSPAQNQAVSSIAV